MMRTVRVTGQAADAKVAPVENSLTTALDSVRQDLEKEHKISQPHDHHSHGHGHGHGHCHAPAPNRPAKIPVKPENEPEYTVVHRGEFDLGNFTNARDVNANRPKVKLTLYLVRFRKKYLFF